MILALKAPSLAISIPRTRLQHHAAQITPLVHSRGFIDSFLNSALGPCPRRKLSHTKTIPYPAETVFKAVSDVAGYPKFLPFAISSVVTARDSAGYPTRAKLKVGFNKIGVEEVWDSVVHCDPKNGTVEAKSGETSSNGLFEDLAARWRIASEDQNGQRGQTKVQLDVDVKFRNSVYDQLFAQLEDQVASSMVSAFEQRVRQIEES